MPVLLFLMLQYESFHTIFSDPESMSKRLKNCISGRIPKVDAVRSIHEEMIDIIKRNRIFRNGTISGYVVAGFDGAELFSSTKKSCPNCLTRKKLTGETEYFYRSVVCMTIGKSPHVILGQEMLKPRDLSGFEMEGCPYKLRVVRYREQWEEKGGKPNVLCGL